MSAGGELGGIDTDFARDLADDGGVRDVAVVHEKGLIHRVNEGRDKFRPVLLQPHDRAFRRHAPDREAAGLPIRHAGVARRALEVALRVTRLGSVELGQRRAAGGFEHRTEQYRLVIDRPPMACGNGFDLLRSEVRVGRRKVEVKLDRLGHCDLQLFCCSI